MNEITTEDNSTEVVADAFFYIVCGFVFETT